MKICKIHEEQGMDGNNFIYIFLDEGGNFDFSSNGTPYFSITSLVVRRPFNVHQKLDAFKHDCIEYGLNTESFHCCEDNLHVRKKVFDIINIHACDYIIDSLIIEKRKVEPALYYPQKFYSKMIGYLLKHVLLRENSDNASEIIVITDALPLQSKRKIFEKTIKQALAEMLPSGCSFRVFHHSAKSHFGLQVADYCNWAIFRKWQKGEIEHYDNIKQAIRSELSIEDTMYTIRDKK